MVLPFNKCYCFCILGVQLAAFNSNTFLVDYFGFSIYNDANNYIFISAFLVFVVHMYFLIIIDSLGFKHKIRHLSLVSDHTINSSGTGP